jgi:hypothetical protein
LKNKVAFSFYSEDSEVGARVDGNGDDYIIHINLTPRLGTDDEELIKIYSLFSVAHEYRHLWQLENGLTTTKEVDYKDRWYEKDADIFAEDFVIEFKKQLL